ncbi:hypothetical protein [Streptosporangium roseum]|uniref:hypothetical protein n=1 Tax=Streptosporangium roseum TaxID=2001 RepID=UPI0033331099
MIARFYGRIEARLLAGADAEDPQACMRMAVIALLRYQPTAAYLWLHRAGDAAGLIRRPSMLMAAAGPACRYGRDYERVERIGVAMFFYRPACSHGHAAAAYQLSLIQQRQDEGPAAVTWPSGADYGGYFRTVEEITSGWAQVSDPPGEGGPCHADRLDRSTGRRRAVFAGRRSSAGFSLTPPPPRP